MSIEVSSNKYSVCSEINESMRKALLKIGMMAETYAKMLCPVDTGLLKNSITYAIGSEQPNITSYTNDEKTETGVYEGSAPEDEDSQMTLYIGTNVQYAPYQELGHNTTTGKWIPPQAFLRPAVENHTREYEEIIKQETAHI